MFPDTRVFLVQLEAPGKHTLTGTTGERLAAGWKPALAQWIPPQTVGVEDQRQQVALAAAFHHAVLINATS